MARRAPGARCPERAAASIPEIAAASTQRRRPRCGSSPPRARCQRCPRERCSPSRPREHVAPRRSLRAVDGRCARPTPLAIHEHVPVEAPGVGPGQSTGRSLHELDRVVTHARGGGGGALALAVLETQDVGDRLVRRASSSRAGSGASCRSRCQRLQQPVTEFSLWAHPSPSGCGWPRAGRPGCGTPVLTPRSKRSLRSNSRRLGRAHRDAEHDLVELGPRASCRPPERARPRSSLALLELVPARLARPGGSPRRHERVVLVGLERAPPGVRRRSLNQVRVGAAR